VVDSVIAGVVLVVELDVVDLLVVGLAVVVGGK